MDSGFSASHQEYRQRNKRQNPQRVYNTQGLRKGLIIIVLTCVPQENRYWEVKTISSRHQVRMFWLLSWWLRLVYSSLSSHARYICWATEVLPLLMSNLKPFDFTIIKTTYEDQTVPEPRKWDQRACTQDRHSCIRQSNQQLPRKM